MKEEQATYSTDDMLQLINTAATNLLLKKKKVSLEAGIRIQRERLEYARELLERARKKVANLAPELREAEERTRESRQQFALLKAERAALESELERLRNMEKKAMLLKQNTAEIAALHKSVALLQERYDRVRADFTEKRAMKEGLGRKERAAAGAVIGMEEKLEALRSAQEQIIVRLSGFDISGHMEALRAEVEGMVNRVRSKITTSAPPMEDPKEELIFLIDYLLCARKVDDLYRRIEETSPEERSMLAGFDVDAITAMKEKIKELATGLVLYGRREIPNLEEQARIIDDKIKNAEERVGQLKSEIQLIEEGLTHEQGFRDRSQTWLKEMTDDCAALDTDVEKAKKNAEKILMARKLDTVFAGALEAANVYLKDVKTKLDTLYEKYTRVFDEIVRVIKGDAETSASGTSKE